MSAVVLGWHLCWLNPNHKPKLRFIVEGNAYLFDVREMFRFFDGLESDYYRGPMHQYVRMVPVELPDLGTPSKTDTGL